MKMSSFNGTTVNTELSTPSRFLGAPSWLLILIVLFLILFPILCLVRLCRCRRGKRKESQELPLFNPSTAPIIQDPEYGKCYTLMELRAATNGFSDMNLMGNGVYRGLLMDNSAIAVRQFPSCAVEELKERVRATVHARHRNLVKLLGYCAEADQRMVVYEYVSNGNLHHWLHRFTGQPSPLTWDARINIITGIAKGLAYLHEGIEPKIAHKNLRSSSILLDPYWGAKITDFGFAKLFGMAKLGFLTEEEDVFSFGVLVMEIVSGRSPVDYRQTQVYIVDWVKTMVAKQELDQVVDPKLSKAPPLKELKRILLIGLRCTDGDREGRPTMGDVIHMLEPRDLLISGVEEQVMSRAESYRNYCQQGI